MCACMCLCMCMCMCVYLCACVYGPRYINANGLQQNVSLLAIVRDLKTAGLMDQLLLHGVSRVSDSQGIETIFFSFFPRATAIPSRKTKKGVPEVGVSEEGVCCKIVFL